MECQLIQDQYTMKKTYHLLHSLNYIMSNKTLWQALSLIAIVLYLAPLVIYGEQVNMLVFDNLDSNVVWYKILAESGMIFAPNTTIIPNMMNGLPRLSYGSEFDIILWFYYFFTPITAYTVNAVIMHLTAFISMYLLAEYYLVARQTRYRIVIVYSISLYFALLPFWPSGGLTVPALPLVTYALLNIYNNKDTYKEWFILLLIPFYSSFVLLYIFYIGFAGIAVLVKSVISRQIRWKILMALVLLTSMYLLVSYRLVLATFFDTGFVSHRTEFNVFFVEPLLDATRRFYLFFLNGHDTHLRGLQMPYLLPTILFSGILLLFNRRLKAYESLVIIAIFLFSLWINIWEDMLGSIYSIPTIIISMIVYSVWKKKIEPLMLWIFIYILVSAVYGYTFYQGFSWILDIVPILKSLSLARAAFVQPLVFVVLLAIAFQVIFRKLHFQVLFLSTMVLLQIYISFLANWHQTKNVKEFATFENYYATEEFTALKQDLRDENLSKVRFLSYGMEPAIALYNGLYTVDGYSTNYPLEYKHEFNGINDVQSNNVFSIEEPTDSDNWGSKLYIMGIKSSYESYQDGLTVNFLSFNENISRELGVKYIISPYWFNYPELKGLKYLNEYHSKKNNRSIYLYMLSKD